MTCKDGFVHSYTYFEILSKKLCIHYGEEDGKWIECGDDFIRLDPTREDPTALEEDTKLRLENIQFIYVSKEKASPEQVQDMFVNPR